MSNPQTDEDSAPEEPCLVLTERTPQRSDRVAAVLLFVVFAIPVGVYAMKQPWAWFAVFALIGGGYRFGLSVEQDYAESRHDSLRITPSKIEFFGDFREALSWEDLTGFKVEYSSETGRTGTNIVLLGKGYVVRIGPGLQHWLKLPAIFSELAVMSLEDRKRAIETRSIDSFEGEWRTEWTNPKSLPPRPDEPWWHATPSPIARFPDQTPSDPSS
ncbi:MAG: hypothetical protein JST40_02365 [Armatimonadetes bacterium]|nr:hypothetical protein [Armatimonadota bacterium]